MTPEQALLDDLRKAGAKPTTDGREVQYDRTKVSAVVQLQVRDMKKRLVTLLTEERLRKGLDYLMGLEKAGKAETDEYRKWSESWNQLLTAYESQSAA